MVEAQLGIPPMAEIGGVRDTSAPTKGHEGMSTCIISSYGY